MVRATCNRFLMTGVLCVTLVAGALSHESRYNSPEEIAVEAALVLAEQGDYAASAAKTRDGLRAVPASALLHNLAGAILLLTGNSSGSQAAFRAALGLEPSSAVARYGLALTDLVEGKLDAAENGLANAGQGNVEVCLLARQYIAFLRGAGIASSLALPASLDFGRRAIVAIAGETAGEMQPVLNEASHMLSDPTVAPYQEYPGPLMTFDRKRPLVFAAQRLPRGLLEVPPVAGMTPMSGVFRIRADETDASYVAFRVDGRFLAVANSRPFFLNWDTTTVPNGPHFIELVAYDGYGQEIRRTRRELVTHNAGAPVQQTLRELENRLWNLLALRPSRAALAMAASRAASRSGDQDAAARWRSLALAIDPDVIPPVRGPATAEEPAFWKADVGEKVVALTFDDGPRPGITEQILDVLSREGVRATFFLIGRHAAAHPQLVANLAQAGMEIANHSFSHPNLARATEAEIRRELLRTSACIEHITRQPPRWFRPPGGNLSPRVSRIAAALGMRACMWTVNGEQREQEGAQRLIAHVLADARPGAVILLHNGRPTTVAALPGIIAGLRRKGYSFVTVSDLWARTLAASTVLQ